MKMLNRTEPHIDSWGTSVITGLQPDFLPLITTLLGPAIQQVFNLSHPLLIQPIKQLCYEDFWETV